MTEYPPTQRRAVDIEGEWRVHAYLAWVFLDSGNALPPMRRRAFTSTSDGLQSIGP